MSLTNYELRVLKAINESEYVDVIGLNDERLINYETWMFDVVDISGISGKKFSGVCASLTKKGFIGTNVELTKKGFIGTNTHTIWMTKEGFLELQKYC